LAPGEFWEQVPASYNAAMAGALKAREERFETDRTLALMTAYFGAQLHGVDWRKMPDWPTWLARMTQPRSKPTDDEILARFAAMSAAGFNVTIN